MANMLVTRRAIQTAFMQLLEERPLNKITVNDIAVQCGLNRNTFYYHYQDIPALIEEICSNEVERIIREYPTLNSIEECLEAGMRYALEKRRAILHIYNSDNRQTYINSLWRMCEHAVSTYVNTVFADARLSDSDRALIIHYHKCECFGLMIDWISKGMREDMLQQMRRIWYLKKGSTESLIQRSMLDGTYKN